MAVCLWLDASGHISKEPIQTQLKTWHKYLLSAVSDVEQPPIHTLNMYTHS